MTEPAFPLDVLSGMRDAACFFCAGFLGANVEVHLRDAGIKTALAIDTDESRLADMEPLYPDAWTFVAADAFDVLTRLVADNAVFDLVTVDPPRTLMPEVFARLPQFRAIAGKHLVMGIEESSVDFAAALGARIMHRSAWSYWAIW